MKHHSICRQQQGLRLASVGRDGSVMLVSLITVLILLLVIGTTMLSTTNKYFTAYQWASWQEALQGAESGADIAMAELRKDVAVGHNASGAVPWAGWNLGKYKTVSGVKVRDTSTYKLVAGDGTYNDGNSGSGNNLPVSVSTVLTGTSPKFDFLTYNTSLSSHAGEGNNNLKITVTVDAPASLIETVTQKHWLRVRASGTTDLTGPARVSEDKLDNRLRKLGLMFDKALSWQGEEIDVTKLKRQSTRQIELIAKPTSLFSGALTAMVQIKGDDKGFVTDSFNSEDLANWPINPGNGEIDLSKSHDPTSPLGKNGDVASNAFPVKHDHSENLDLHRATIWGDVGNNYSEIKNIDASYYGQTPDPSDYGLNNGNFGTTNPNSKLLKTNNNTTEGGDVSGNIATNYYRDLPPVQDPNWTSSTPGFSTAYTTINNKSSDWANLSLDKTTPSRIKVDSITLKNKDKWSLKQTKQKVNGVDTVVDTYAEIWVTGDIKLDDGGTLAIEPGVHLTVYFDKNIKVGEEVETKTNKGGFDTQSDDAKDLLLLGVTQPDSAKMPKDSYIDPLGNESLYTPYKASGNIVFHQNDVTGAIYAPDHNIVFESDDDGKGKRRKRPQKGNEFYGAYVGRTIHSKKFHYFHYDESLNDAGPTFDWAYVSWFEDVDVDNR